MLEISRVSRSRSEVRDKEIGGEAGPRAPGRRGVHLLLRRSVRHEQLDDVAQRLGARPTVRVVPRDQVCKQQRRQNFIRLVWTSTQCSVHRLVQGTRIIFVKQARDHFQKTHRWTPSSFCLRWG